MTRGGRLAAVLGVVAALSSVPTARAECSSDWEYAVVRAQATCDEAAQSWLEDDGLPVEVIGGQGGMWEACMRLSTPLGPLPAAVHYDTTDGAFWYVR